MTNISVSQGGQHASAQREAKPHKWALSLWARAFRRVARRWTVDDLGREVGLSRSALADRFIRLIGVPPMHYLAGWRMQVATQKLRNTSASLAEVADLVGYSSEAAFSRAFKKAFGTAPATWRRSNR